ncbi:MAG: TIGR02221 family CRISPR-associated protein [Candidatus Dadabacteria bacterium]|nr:TIGR02221 family CRISPR-associated protein [Candidatus Dadabacteria bacterium]
MNRHHTLITFLGRSKSDPKAGYRKANYLFPMAKKPVSSTFFGLAISEKINPKPDSIVILGSSGSSWSMLVENLEKNGQDEARFDLLQAEESGSVNQALLDLVTPLMEQGFGTNVKSKIIPVGKTDEEHLEILRIISSCVESGDVSIDITHGFRYFGMIGFLSAWMLEHVHNDLHVKELWYGALDLTEKCITPVLRLNGLSRVRSWIDAINRFDATGEYADFASLLVGDGVPERSVRCLKRAAFFEQTLNLRGAARELQRFLPVLKKPLPGASELFRDRLAQRLSWCENAKLGVRQKQLARMYIDRHDYLRASVFGLEAVISLELENRGNLKSDEFQVRKRIKQELLECDEASREMRLLRCIRNALAHGDPGAAGPFYDILTDPNRLGRELKQALGKLL